MFLNFFPCVYILFYVFQSNAGQIGPQTTEFEYLKYPYRLIMGKWCFYFPWMFTYLRTIQNTLIYACWLSSERSLPFGLLVCFVVVVVIVVVSIVSDLKLYI